MGNCGKTMQKIIINKFCNLAVIANQCSFWEHTINCFCVCRTKYIFLGDFCLWGNTFLSCFQYTKEWYLKSSFPMCVLNLWQEHILKGNIWGIGANYLFYEILLQINILKCAITFEVGWGFQRKLKNFYKKF